MQFKAFHLHRSLRLTALCGAAAAGMLFMPPASPSVSASEPDTESITEFETETETEPDPRLVWYEEQMSALPENTGEEAAGSVSDKLMKLSETDLSKQAETRRKVRRKLAAYMQENLGIILSETYAVHYIYSDDADYTVISMGENTYIYEIGTTKKGNPKILETDADETVRKALIDIASFTPSKSDVHYWNGISTDDADSAFYAGLPVSEEGVRAVPYYNQGLGFWSGTKGWTCTDWPTETFDINGHTMKEAGCGFFAAAMAVSYLRPEIISPVDFKENGQYTGDGAAVTVGLESAGMYGIKAVITSNWEEAYEALQNGYLVMENVGPGVFARYGHFILLTGILDNGQIVVNDPGNEYHSYWYDWEAFDVSVFPDSMHDFQTAFTIFG